MQNSIKNLYLNDIVILYNTEIPLGDCVESSGWVKQSQS